MSGVKDGSIVRLRDLYRSDAPRAQVARAISSHIAETGCSLTALARSLGVAAAVVHQYLGVARKLAPPLFEAFERGQLTFKEARALADVEPASRQIEVAEPFVSGRLGSGYVERVVKMARSLPSLTIDGIVDMVRGDGPARAQPPMPVDGVRLEKRLGRLADELGGVDVDSLEESSRMPVVWALEILAERCRRQALTLRINNAKGRGLAAALRRGPPPAREATEPQFPDTGCELGPACLDCTRPHCRYDTPYEAQLVEELDRRVMQRTAR